MFCAGPSKFQTLLISAAVILASLGSWKGYQDLDDLAFAQAKLSDIQTTAAEASTNTVLQRQSAREHRNSLLAISQKERTLHSVDGNSALALSLRESIEQASDRLVASTYFRPVTLQRPADLSEVEYDTRWAGDAHRGLLVDLSLIGVAILCSLWAVAMWLIDRRRLRARST